MPPPLSPSGSAQVFSICLDPEMKNVHAQPTLNGKEDVDGKAIWFLIDKYIWVHPLFLISEFNLRIF